VVIEGCDLPCCRVAVKLGVVGGVVVVVLPSGFCCLMEEEVLRDQEMSWMKTTCSVCVAFESGRHTAVVVTGCLASPGHGVTGSCEGLFDRPALASRR
jgi:hypothetical protein